MRTNRLGYAFCLLSFCVIALVARQLQWDAHLFEKAGVADLILFALRGEPISAVSGGHLPLIWIFPQLLLAVLIASYPATRPQGFDVHTLVRIGNSYLWWLSRWVCALLTVFGWYLTLVLGSWLVGLAYGMKWSWTAQFEASVNGINTAAISLGPVMAVILVGLLSTFVTVTFQMVTSTVVGSVGGFMLTVGYLMVASMSKTRYLPAVWAMTCRTRISDPTAISTSLMAIILMGLMVILLACALPLTRRAAWFSGIGGQGFLLIKRRFHAE